MRKITYIIYDALQIIEVAFSPKTLPRMMTGFRKPPVKGLYFSDLEQPSHELGPLPLHSKMKWNRQAYISSLRFKSKQCLISQLLFIFIFNKLISQPLILHDFNPTVNVHDHEIVKRYVTNKSWNLIKKDHETTQIHP